MAKAKAAKVKTEYAFRPGARFPVPAAVAGPAIEAIQAANGGSATPADVVAAARDPGHPLHPVFVWDDDAAAEKYRQHQARMLMNSVRVVVRREGGGEQRQVAFLSVSVREQGRAYVPTAVALSDDEYRAEAVAEALAALRGWRARHKHLSELADLFAAVDGALAKVA